MTPRRRKPRIEPAPTLTGALAAKLHQATPLQAVLLVVSVSVPLLILKASPELRSLICGPEVRRQSDAVMVKSAPSGPLPGQALPPCESPGLELLRGCWMPARDERGGQKTGCLNSPSLYEIDGLCWLPMLLKTAPRTPNASDVHATPL